MTRTTQIDKATFDFLKALNRNNNRDWFQQHKSTVQKAQDNVGGFLDALMAEMNKHDRLETRSGKQCLYRIYNDVRFSADKTPYNPRFAGSFRRIKPWLRGGYYFWLKPGASRVGCGFTYPNAEDLTRVRHDIATNYGDWKKLLANKKLVSTFGAMCGDQVKTAPRGFAKDDPAIELLRFKQYWFEHHFTDAEVLSPKFLQHANQTFKNIRPFFDYMTEVLTTDANGVSLLEK
jgi:uncharacterized protein (TIGR02453 family)